MYRNLIKSMTPITNKEYEYGGAKAMEYSHVLHQFRFQYILDDFKTTWADKIWLLHIKQYLFSLAY